jgi:hypothetical protein
METMLFNNGINPVELFRDVKIEPRRRPAHVNEMVWIGAATPSSRQCAQSELVGNQALETYDELPQVFFTLAPTADVNNF